MRAVSPVVGVVTLAGLTVLLSATLLGTAALEPSQPGPTTSLAVSVDASADRIELAHRGGDALDVTEMDVRVTVDGDELRHQPPVPFFAADGFESGPEGVVNSASSNRFRAGEQTSFVVASTNSPEIRNGVTVSVRVTVEGTVLYEAQTTAT